MKLPDGLCSDENGAVEMQSDFRKSGCFSEVCLSKMRARVGCYEAVVEAGIDMRTPTGMSRAAAVSKWLEGHWFPCLFS